MPSSAKYQRLKALKQAKLDGHSPHKEIKITPSLPWEERLRLQRLEWKRQRLQKRKNAGYLDETYEVRH